MNEKPHRVQIPFPGGSGRIPTGAMQFADDWAGIFVRGDDAIHLAFSIRQLQDRLSSSNEMEVAFPLHRLVKFAEIIERDVQVRADESPTSNQGLDP